MSPLLYKCAFPRLTSTCHALCRENWYIILVYHTVVRVNRIFPLVINFDI